MSAGVMGEDMVEVDKDELEGLRRDARFLRALEAAGVDNWDGYSCAQEIARGGR